MAEIAATAGTPAERVRPDNSLASDLGFDGRAFAQLLLLLFESYELRDRPSAFGPAGEAMTVEKVFDDYVLAPREARRRWRRRVAPGPAAAADEEILSATSSAVARRGAGAGAPKHDAKRR